MATAMYSATISAATIVKTSQQKRNKVKYISGLNTFGGLKANNNNNVVSLGLPVCTQQSFAKIVSSLRSTGKGGGATCNAAAEIFRIAAIMPALVLVGVAVGFVLLRLEASIEEAE
ncbi:hypothetical protein Leryth_023265 [Lithospermum erythrorhizon]|uniref:Cytochrome b6-f complex subunit 7 n=1 Tax=Lithospermum erythrorhizon TaxID=34254 RepID=A0AAV3R7K8_LITER|nr:hypothetical protein Leryth_023265 [Lithospermum erythrorhizon]